MEGRRKEREGRDRGERWMGSDGWGGMEGRGWRDEKGGKEEGVDIDQLLNRYSAKLHSTLGGLF